jgi:hypothetical protein
MPQPIRRLIAGSLAALVLSSCQAPLAGSDPGADLEPTHKALLETFLPTQGLPWDPAATWHVFQVQIGSWSVLSRSESHLRRLGDLQARWAAWADKPAPTFRQATIDQRERFLFRLQTSDDSAARRLSRELRLLIVGALYASPLGTAVSGVAAPPRERPDWKTY